MAKKTNTNTSNPSNKMDLLGKAFDNCFLYYNTEKKQVSLCLKCGDNTLAWLNGFDAVNAVNALLDACTNEGTISEVTPVEVNGHTYYNYTITPSECNEIPFS